MERGDECACETYQHANSVLSKIVRFEFLSEQVIHYMSRSGKSMFSESRFLTVLPILELVKIYYKKQKYGAVESRIYLSEDNPQVIADEQNRQKCVAFERFFAEDYSDKYKNLTAEDLQKKISETLERIKGGRTQSSLVFNSEYVEELQRSHKQIGLLSKLPIPRQLLSTTHQQDKMHHKLVRFGEWIFMIRPFIYALSLKIFGLQSYTPYIISLLCDLLRILLQRNVKFYQPAHKEEFKQRNKEMVLNYLLRNPFYSQVFKVKVLIPMMHSLFGKRFTFIQDFIIGLIEMRCSICLLL